MPLTLPEKNDIKAALNHILDFPTELSELQQRINFLTITLLSPEAVDADEFGFSILRDCLKNPADVLKNLTRTQPDIVRSVSPQTINDDDDEDNDTDTTLSDAESLADNESVYHDTHANDELAANEPEQFPLELDIPTDDAEVDDDSREPSPALTLTVGEVKEYVLTLITEALAESTVSFEEMGWNFQRIKDELITADDYQSPFINQTSTFSTFDVSWQLPTIEGKIYSINAYYPEPDFITQESMDVKLNYQITLANKTDFITLTIIKRHLPYLNEREFINFQDRLMENNRMRALDTMVTDAGKRALNYLLSKNYENMVFEDIEEARSDKVILNLITTQFYFNKLEQGELHLKHFFLTEEQIDNLIHPNVIALQQRGLMDFNSGLSLRPLAWKVIGERFYFNALLKGTLHVSELDCSRAIFQFLIHPSTVNLLTQAKLTFAEAKAIPVFLHKLFISSYYLEYFASQPINWQAWIRISKAQAALFFLPKYNEDGRVRDENGERATIVNKHIAKLIVTQVVTPTNISNLNERLIELLNDNPDIFYWLETGLFDFSFLERMTDIATFYKQIYGLRLSYLFNDIPAEINGENDSYHRIGAELRLAARTCEQAPEVLFDNILQEFIVEYLKHSIEESKNICIIKLLPTYILDHLLNTINEAMHANSDNWQHTLTLLFTSAELSYQQISIFLNNTTFFPHREENSTQLMLKKLISLAPPA